MNNRDRAKSIQAMLLADEWWTAESIRKATRTTHSVPHRHRKTLEAQGHRFEVEYNGRREPSYRHHPKCKCRTRTPSKELVPVNQAKPSTRRGRGGAAVSLAPPLDSSVTINMLRREHDGQLTLGLVGDTHEYVVRLVGAMPLEMAE